MRTLSSAVILLACVGLALLGCTDKSQSVVAPTDQAGVVKEQGGLAKVTLTPFTATDILGTISDYGEWKFVGTRTIVKRLVGTDRLESENELVAGSWTITLSIEQDINTGEGPMQAKFTMTPDVGGGVWVGMSEGLRRWTGAEWTSNIKGVAQGKGGTIDGMQLSFNELLHETLTTYSGEVDGYIKSH